MFYQSKYKELKIVIKATFKKEVQGEIFTVQGEYIKFKNFRFTPQKDEDGVVVAEDAKKMEILDAMIEKGKTTIWKITDEQIEIADAYQKEIEAINKKFAEKRELLAKMEIKDGKAQVVRGAVSTEKPPQKESEVVIPAVESATKEKEYPEVETDITEIEGGGNGKIEIDEPPSGDMATPDDMAKVAAQDAVSDMQETGL